MNLEHRLNLPEPTIVSRWSGSEYVDVACGESSVTLISTRPLLFHTRIALYKRLARHKERARRKRVRRIEEKLSRYDVDRSEPTR